MAKNQVEQVAHPTERHTPEPIGTTETTITLQIESEFLEMMARRRGHTTITEYLTALVEQDDEAMWDEQFAASQEKLERMEAEALAEHAAGLTEEFDPDTDPDAP